MKSNAANFRVASLAEPLFLSDALARLASLCQRLESKEARRLSLSLLLLLLFFLEIFWFVCDHT